MSSLLSKNCAECNALFYKKQNCSMLDWITKRKYCSLTCSKKNTLLDGSKQPPLSSRPRGEKNNKWKGGDLQKVCLVCNNSYFVDRYRINSKLCSKECDKKYRQSIEFRTNLSNTQRKKYPNNHKFVRSFNSLLRTCFKYSMWRDEVLKRDDYTCAHCDKRGGKLHVDHIEPFIAIILRNNVKNYEDALECKDLWKIENGQTLCRPCHYKTPTFGAKALKHLSELTQ